MKSDTEKHYQNNETQIADDEQYKSSEQGKTSTKKKVLYSLLILFLIAIFLSIVTIGVYEYFRPEHVNVNKFKSNDCKVDVKKYAGLTKSIYKDIIFSCIAPKPQESFSLNPQKQSITVLHFDKKWRKIFDYNVDYYNNTPQNLTIAPRILSGKDAFLLSDIEGSGGYLSYIVFGYNKGKICIFLNRDGLFNGSVKVEGQNIIETGGESSTTFHFNGKSFEGTKLAQQTYGPYSTRDKLVNYRIDSNCNVSLSAQSVSMHIGDKLIISKAEDSFISARLLLSSPMILSEEDDTTFVAQKKGTVSITIIPNAYLNTKSAIIKINVL